MNALVGLILVIGVGTSVYLPSHFKTLVDPMINFGGSMK
jgi:hypothetical protein